MNHDFIDLIAIDLLMLNQEMVDNLALTDIDANPPDVDLAGAISDIELFIIIKYDGIWMLRIQHLLVFLLICRIYLFFSLPQLLPLLLRCRCHLLSCFIFLRIHDQPEHVIFQVIIIFIKAFFGANLMFSSIIDVHLL